MERTDQQETRSTPYTCTAIGEETGLSNGDDQQGKDVEHIVGLAEAHNSGLNAEDMLTFSDDPLNLTVAMPYENRTVKSDRDAADYLSEHNQCWFAGRVIAVEQNWGLSVDRREAQFLETTLPIARQSRSRHLASTTRSGSTRTRAVSTRRPSDRPPRTGRRALVVALAEIGRRKLAILKSFGVTIVKLRLTRAR